MQMSIIFNYQNSQTKHLDLMWLRGSLNAPAVNNNNVIITMAFHDFLGTAQNYFNLLVILVTK